MASAVRLSHQHICSDVSAHVCTEIYFCTEIYLGSGLFAAVHFLLLPESTPKLRLVMQHDVSNCAAEPICVVCRRDMHW